MLFVESVMACIHPTILPHIVAKAMHNSILEGALEVSTIGPLEAAIAAHFVIQPQASILGAICPEVDALTLLDAILKVSVIVTPIAPDLDAFAVLPICLRFLRLCGFERV